MTTKEPVLNTTTITSTGTLVVLYTLDFVSLCLYWYAYWYGRDYRYYLYKYEYSSMFLASVIVLTENNLEQKHFFKHY
jgi:hypothetical protein